MGRLLVALFFVAAMLYICTFLENIANGFFENQGEYIMLLFAAVEQKWNQMFLNQCRVVLLCVQVHRL